MVLKRLLILIFHVLDVVASMSEKIKLDELAVGLRKRILSNLSHADEILYVEEYDPTHGGYVDTHEEKRYVATYKYKGQIQKSSFSMGRSKFYI